MIDFFVDLGRGISGFFVTAWYQMLDSFADHPLAQAIGLLSLILSLISFQQKKRMGILLFQMAASFSCAVSLILLGGIAGGLLDLIAFSRTVVFSLRDRYSWASSPVWLIFYAIVIVAVGILTGEQGSFVSLFAVFGTLFSTVALWMRSEKRMRTISLFAGPCWIAYNLYYSSCFGVLNELIAMTSIVIALIRLRNYGKNSAGAEPKDAGQA